MPSTRSHEFKLFLNDDEREALRRASAATGVSQQQLVRNAVAVAIQSLRIEATPARLPYDDDGAAVSKDELLKMPTMTVAH